MFLSVRCGGNSFPTVTEGETVDLGVDYTLVNDLSATAKVTVQLRVGRDVAERQVVKVGPQSQTQERIKTAVTPPKAGEYDVAVEIDKSTLKG